LQVALRVEIPPPQVTLQGLQGEYSKKASGQEFLERKQKEKKGISQNYIDTSIFSLCVKVNWYGKFERLQN
jgi:hypothetical protein